MIPGLLGFLWLIAWRRLYQPPENHDRISSAELEYITADKSEDNNQSRKVSLGWFDLLRFPQTWGIIVSRLFTDPVWFFVTDWFPIYLVAKGIELKTGLIAVWIPFVAADLGNFFGGAVSGYLIRRGWSVGAARKALVVFGGVGVMTLIPTIFTSNLYLIAGLFGLASLAYSAFSTMANVLPSDVFHGDAVASVSGLSGSAAGVGTILAFYFVGHLSDARQSMGSHSFDPIIIAAGLVSFSGMLLVLWLIRNTRATEEGFVKRV